MRDDIVDKFEGIQIHQVYQPVSIKTYNRDTITFDEDDYIIGARIRNTRHKMRRVYKYKDGETYGQWLTNMGKHDEFDELDADDGADGAQEEEEEDESIYI